MPVAVARCAHSAGISLGGMHLPLFADDQNPPCLHCLQVTTTSLS